MNSRPRARRPQDPQTPGADLIGALLFFGMMAAVIWCLIKMDRDDHDACAKGRGVFVSEINDCVYPKDGSL